MIDTTKARAPKVVLTGFEESKPFIFELDGTIITGPINRYLVFNDGALRVPCDDVTFNQLVTYWNYLTDNSDQKPRPPYRDVPDGAEVFSATDNQISEAPKTKQAYLPVLPDPPLDDDDEDWSGEQDDADDGVGQL